MTGRMPVAAEPSMPTTATRFAVAVVVAFALFGRAVFLLLPVNSDTAMFVYAGKLVAEGGRPGVDLLDNKLPTVGLLMSVPWRVFGAHWTAYAALGLSFSVGGILLLCRSVRQTWGGTAATVVGVAAATWLNFMPAAYGALQLEIIQAFFGLVAAGVTLRLLRTADWRDALLIGLCGGVAVWAKPTGGAVAGAAAMAVLGFGAGRWTDRLRIVFWVALGVMFPVVLAGWTMVVTDTADALPETLRQLRDYSSQSTFDAMDAAKPVLALGLLAFPVLVLGVVGRRDRRATTAGRADTAFVLLWLTAELVGVVAQRRMYAYHFLTLAGPAALACGLVARRRRPALLVMAFGPVVAVSAATAVMAWSSEPTTSRDERVIAYLLRHSRDTDAVWCDDYPRLLVESGRPAGSRVPLIFLMANGDAAPDHFGGILLDDFADRRPQFIALASDPMRVAALYRHHMAEVAASPARADAIDRQMSAIGDYVRAHYAAAAEFDGVTVWRRRDDGPRTAVVASGVGR